MCSSLSSPWQAEGRFLISLGIAQFSQTDWANNAVSFGPRWQDCLIPLRCQCMLVNGGYLTLFPRWIDHVICNIKEFEILWAQLVLVLVAQYKVWTQHYLFPDDQPVVCFLNVHSYRYMWSWSFTKLFYLLLILQIQSVLKPWQFYFPSKFPIKSLLAISGLTDCPRSVSSLLDFLFKPLFFFFLIFIMLC